MNRMSKKLSQYRFHERRGTSGFTIVELLIAAGMSVILMATVTVIFTQAITASKDTTRKIDLLQTARNIVSILEDNMESAIMVPPEMFNMVRMIQEADDNKKLSPNALFMCDDQGGRDRLLFTYMGNPYLSDEEVQDPDVTTNRDVGDGPVLGGPGYPLPYDGDDTYLRVAFDFINTDNVLTDATTGEKAFFRLGGGRYEGNEDNATFVMAGSCMVNTMGGSDSQVGANFGSITRTKFHFLESGKPNQTSRMYSRKFFGEFRHFKELALKGQVTKFNLRFLRADNIWQDGWDAEVGNTLMQIPKAVSYELTVRDLDDTDLTVSLTGVIVMPTRPITRYVMSGGDGPALSVSTDHNGAPEYAYRYKGPQLVGRDHFAGRNFGIDGARY